MSYIRMSDLGRLRSTGMGQVFIPDDARKVAIWGKTGCFVSVDTNGNPRFSPGADPSGFAPMSPEQIVSSKIRIGQLQGTLERKRSQVETYGSDAIVKYGEYLKTSIPSCVTFTGVLKSIASLGIASPYQSCLNARELLYGSLTEANQAFTNMTNSRLDFYADYQEVMRYAPNQDAWLSLCNAKLAAEQSFQNLSVKVTKLAVDASEKLKDENAALVAQTDMISTLIQLLQVFMAALKAMVELIASVFKEVFTVVAKAAGFLAQYPSVALYGAGAVGILALGGFGWWQYKKIKSVLKA